MGAGEHGDLAAPQVRRAGGDEASDQLGLGVLVAGGAYLHRRSILARRDGVTTLARHAQHVHPGGDDLRRRSAVRRQADDLDTGQVTIDVDEQRGVSAVESVDRLRRVADQEEVVVPSDEQTEQVVLHRVEVLRLVDEEMSKAPADDLGEVVIGVDLTREHQQQVVDVDDTATPFGRLVVGEHLCHGGEGDAAMPLGGPRRGGVSVGLDAAGSAPRAFGSDGVDRAPPSDLSDQATTVVGDVRRRPTAVRPALAHHAEGDGVERAGLDRFANPGGAESAAQLAGCLSRERQCKGVAGLGRPGGDPVGDPSGEHAGLAGAGCGDDGDERRRCRDRGALCGVEITEEGRLVHDDHCTAGVSAPFAGTLVEIATDTVSAMPYPKKLLNDYEELAVDLHPHWLYFFEAVFALVAAIALGIFVVAVDAASRIAVGRTSSSSSRAPCGWWFASSSGPRRTSSSPATA